MVLLLLDFLYLINWVLIPQTLLLLIDAGVSLVLSFLAFMSIILAADGDEVFL
jgi:hypothetical protein